MIYKQVMKIAQQIESHQRKMRKLLAKIENSDHPNAQRIGLELWGQCVPSADATAVVSTHLNEKG